MHGNAGNRLESLPLLQYVIPAGYALLTFDFSGCGISQGDLVTLGPKEVEDLKSVVI